MTGAEWSLLRNDGIGEAYWRITHDGDLLLLIKHWSNNTEESPTDGI